MARLAGRPLCILAVVAAGCGVLTQEEQILTDFFEASRLHDTTAVARMSSVTFNPRTDGVVQEFAVERTDTDEDGQSRAVSVLAQVRRPDGQVTARRMRVTLTRRDGRWFITDLRGGP